MNAQQKWVTVLVKERSSDSAPRRVAAEILLRNLRTGMDAYTAREYARHLLQENPRARICVQELFQEFIPDE